MKPVQCRSLCFQVCLRLDQTPFSLGQGFGLAADRFFLNYEGLVGSFRILQFGSPFFQPDPGRSSVPFQLCGSSIQFGLAMVEFLLPTTEVLGQLRRLDFDLARDRFRIRRRRGVVLDR